MTGGRAAPTDDVTTLAHQAHHVFNPYEEQIQC